MSRVPVEANFVFVVVRAKALFVGTDYLKLGAKTEQYPWAARDNYESSACESNFVSIRRTVSCSIQGNGKQVPLYTRQNIFFDSDHRRLIEATRVHFVLPRPAVY